MPSEDFREEQLNSGATQLSEWVPQIFYDVIGRVIPGAILLLMSFYILRDCPFFVYYQPFLYVQQISHFLLFIIGILVSYFVGIVLGAIGYCISGNEDKIEVDDINFDSVDFNDKSAKLSYIYDVIQHMAPKAGARLAKLSAERNMCRVFIAGFIILIIINIWNCIIVRRSPWGTILLLILCIASARLFLKHLVIRSRWLMRNYWHILGKPVPGNQNTGKSDKTAKK